MKTFIRPWRHAALAAAAVLLATAGTAAQNRSTGNPHAGLRGNSDRGVALRGASSRGFSDRQTAKEQPRPVEEDLATVTPGSGGQAPTTPGAPRAVVAPGQFLPRLVTPKTGPVLRGLARFVNGQWAVLTANGPRILPADEVESARLERDVLAELDVRLRALDPHDPAARVALARWMLEQGLVDEGLAEVDALLARDEDGHGAVAMLREVDLPPVVAQGTARDAGGIARLLDRGARSTLAVQELLILELVPFGAANRNELARLLHQRRGSQDADERAFAERALRRLFPASRTVAVADPADVR